MTKLRSIDPKPFNDRLMLGGGPVAPSLGDKPQLRWIAIECLRIDAVYQREITRASSKNVIKIARDFDWSMFAPCIVVEEKQGIYIVVDGQHRATAAALRGVRDVPCQIVVADAAKQAAAFAAINANITRITTLQLYYARLAAGDPAARHLYAALELGGARVARHYSDASKIEVGETIATSQLGTLLNKYGTDTFAQALRCITRSGDGHAGFVRAPIVDAICATLEAEPSFVKNETKLLKAMGKFDFAVAFDKARIDAGGKHSQFAAAFLDLVSAHLDRELGSKAA